MPDWCKRKSLSLTSNKQTLATSTVYILAFVAFLCEIGYKMCQCSHWWNKVVIHGGFLLTIRKKNYNTNIFLTQLSQHCTNALFSYVLIRKDWRVWAHQQFVEDRGLECNSSTVFSEEQNIFLCWLNHRYQRLIHSFIVMVTFHVCSHVTRLIWERKQKNKTDFIQIEYESTVC